MNTTPENITHTLPTLMAYPALLAGFQTMDEALNDHLFRSYFNAVVQEDFEHTDLNINALAGSLSQLCCEGTNKLPDYLLPTLNDLLSSNRDIHRMAFLLAAYGHYLTSRDAENPLSTLPDTDWSYINSDDVAAFLRISSLSPARLYTYSHFVGLYRSYRTQIAKYGILFLLRQMAYNRQTATA